MLTAFLALGAAPAYRIIDLGAPSGVESVEASAINNLGEVLVQGDANGHLWRNGRFFSFGKPKESRMETGPGRTEPRSLNDHSVAVGGQGGYGPVFMTGLEDAEAFVWRGKGMEAVGAGDTSEARSINNLGDIVGVSGHRATDPSSLISGLDDSKRDWDG